MSNETKHTPGPWDYSKPALSLAVYAADIHIADVFAKVPNGLSEIYVLEPEAEANARLIASAPELQSLKSWLARTDEAISKAKGHAQ